MHVVLRNSRLIAYVIWCVLMWVFFVYLYVRILDFHQASSPHPVISVLYLVQFGVHEIGHLLCILFPPIMTAMAGTLCELAFTCLVVLAGVRSKSPLVTVFGFLWVMLAFMSIGNYMADARTQLLPLAGMGPDPVHDWYFIFSWFGWLEADNVIAAVVKATGWLVGAGGLAYGLYYIITILLGRTRATKDLSSIIKAAEVPHPSPQPPQGK